MIPVTDPEQQQANRRLQRAMARELRVSRRIGRLLTDDEAAAMVGLYFTYDPLAFRAEVLSRRGTRLIRRTVWGKPMLIAARAA